MGALGKSRAKLIAEWAKKAPLDTARMMTYLRTGSRTLAEVASHLDTTQGRVLDAINGAIALGRNVVRLGDRYTIGQDPAQVEHDPSIHLWKSDARGRYRFGLISDTHYGSKYAREDVADELYDWFAREGVSRVYHAGNWIEGEARFNRFDLIDAAHGMQNQLDYMVARYPLRSGITTYYVAGDDHEGWYAQREGVDIGRMLESTANAAGRRDLRYIGYMESFVTLEHRRTGETSKLLVAHPGGGSAYALSYAPQKVAESWQSGEKPGCVLFGHWHKLEYAIIRGVHSIQAGCTKAADPFARKKRLQYHVGGWIVELGQDPAGALTGCKLELRQWFDRDYHNGQWSHSGDVRPTRAPHGKPRRRR